MSDKHLVIYGHSLAYKGVGRYFAACPDYSALLNLNERADPASVAYAAAVEIDERGVKDLYVFPKRNAVSNRHFPAVLSIIWSGHPLRDVLRQSDPVLLSFFAGATETASVRAGNLFAQLKSQLKGNPTRKTHEQAIFICSTLALY